MNAMYLPLFVSYQSLNGTLVVVSARNLAIGRLNRAIVSGELESAAAHSCQSDFVYVARESNGTPNMFASSR